MAGRLRLDTGPHGTSPHRGRTHQIIVPFARRGTGAHFLTLCGLWVSEITLESAGQQGPHRCQATASAASLQSQTVKTRLRLFKGG